jgi:hypothetical protein
MTTYSDHEQRMLDQASFREEEAADIAKDIAAYNKAMGEPDGWRECLRIEKKYLLDGLPPQMVSEELARMHDEASGK